MVASDAIDLASTYNRLGLALRDSGKDDVATKEAFLAGLEGAPQDLSLLVNGGVAHQVRTLMFRCSHDHCHFRHTTTSFWFDVFIQVYKCGHQFFDRLLISFGVLLGFGP